MSISNLAGVDMAQFNIDDEVWVKERTTNCGPNPPYGSGRIINRTLLNGKWVYDIWYLIGNRKEKNVDAQFISKYQMPLSKSSRSQGILIFLSGYLSHTICFLMFIT